MQKVCHNLTINIHRKRPTPEDITNCDVCDGLNTSYINETREEERNIFPPHYEVNKVTECSAATIPLTDGQTPSGDQLSVTDFKAAISWYGKLKAAVVKFPVIDLEARRGDKAQAEQYALAA